LQAASPFPSPSAAPGAASRRGGGAEAGRQERRIKTGSLWVKAGAARRQRALTVSSLDPEVVSSGPHAIRFWLGSCSTETPFVFPAAMFLGEV